MANARENGEDVTNHAQLALDDITATVPTASWSICVRDGNGVPLATHQADTVLPTASVGKVLLLVELARIIHADPAAGALVLSRSSVDPVAEAGLWQHLAVDSLSVADLAVFVSAFSDNLATNVLINHVGLETVQALGRSLGLVHTALLDRVRRVRSPDHPAHLSVGTAAELSQLMYRLSGGSVVSAAVSGQVLQWMATDADLSMTAAAFGLDPLAHQAPDRGMLLRHKTGSDAGTRAEVGVLRWDARVLTYAVIAHWDTTCADLRDPVLDGMHRIGVLLRRLLS